MQLHWLLYSIAINTPMLLCMQQASTCIYMYMYMYTGKGKARQGIRQGRGRERKREWRDKEREGGKDTGGGREGGRFVTTHRRNN